MRRRIYTYIKANPGIHFRKMQRDLSLAVGQLDFHLNSLIKNELIVKETAGGNARYYVRDRFSREEKVMMSALRRDIPRGIVLHLLENPDDTPSRILRYFKFTNATLSYHLRRLEKAGVLEAEMIGRERHYRVRDPELVNLLLISYSTTLVDTIVDGLS